MGDVLSIFKFKNNEFNEPEVKALLSMLSNEEKKVFSILKLSDVALSSIQVYSLYMSLIIKEHKLDKEKLNKLSEGIRGKKAIELKAKFIRDQGLEVPTNRTITRVLENLFQASFIVKREPKYKRAKAYYNLHPKLRLILQRIDDELSKKMNIQNMQQQLRMIKQYLKTHKKTK